MKKSGMVISLLLSIIGLMILVAPEQFIKAVVIIFGITAFVDGIINITSVRQLIDDEDFRKKVLIRGWLSILVGFLAVMLPLVFAATMWTIMLYVLAVYLVLTAFLECYTASKLKKAEIPIKTHVIETIICLVSAALLFAIPGQIGILIVKIFGGAIILFAIIILLYSIKSKPLTIEPDSVVDDTSEN